MFGPLFDFVFKSAHKASQFFDSLTSSRQLVGQELRERLNAYESCRIVFQHIFHMPQRHPIEIPDDLTLLPLLHILAFRWVVKYALNLRQLEDGIER